MNKDRKINLISGIAFFILGLIIFLKPSLVVKFISYFLGGIIIIIGFYKTINYYIQNKQLKIVNRNELAFGVTAILLGIVFIFLADAIELLLRFLVGIWVIIAGLNKIMATFYTTDRTYKFYSLIVIGLILIGVGFYIVFVSNLAISIIGLIMMIYGIIDFVSFFVFKNMIVKEGVSIEKSQIMIQDAEVVEKEDNKKEDNKKNKKSNK